MNQSLMSYIGSNPTQGARKYTGPAATGYDAKRQESPKWKAEQAIIENFIDALPMGSTALDVPVGTGRFIPAYERKGLEWTGIDLSEDMLAESIRKVTNGELATLYNGDVTRLVDTMGDNAVDVALMVRLTRWLTPKQRARALKQLQLISRRFVVFTARTANHPHAYPLEDIEAALDKSWRITRNIECGEPDYRVIVLEKD